MITQHNFKAQAIELGATEITFLSLPKCNRGDCTFARAKFDRSEDARAFAELCSESRVVERAQIINGIAVVRFI